MDQDLPGSTTTEQQNQAGVPVNEPPKPRVCLFSVNIIVEISLYRNEYF